MSFSLTIHFYLIQAAFLDPPRAPLTLNSEPWLNLLLLFDPSHILLNVLSF